MADLVMQTKLQTNCTAPVWHAESQAETIEGKWRTGTHA
jgi:hypothetical protein